MKNLRKVLVGLLLGLTIVSCEKSVFHQGEVRDVHIETSYKGECEIDTDGHLISYEAPVEDNGVSEYNYQLHKGEHIDIDISKNLILVVIVKDTENDIVIDDFLAMSDTEEPHYTYTFE